MSVEKFKLIQVNSIAVNNDILKKRYKKRYSFNSDPIDKIIRKFKEDRIITEKLRDNLFALKLNKKVRAICERKNDCLVVQEILEEHEYDRSKYLNESNSLFKGNIVEVVAASGNSDTNQAKLPKIEKLPEIWNAYINDKIVILDKEQVDILYAETARPTIFTVIGNPGSGKTTIAELLIHQNANEHEKKSLYVTRTKELVSFVEKQCSEAANIDYITLEKLMVRELSLELSLEITLEIFCGQDEFIKWLNKNKEYKEFSNYEMGRCLYEDIRKSYSNFFTSNKDYSIGQKESYDCLDKDKYKEILASYKQHLRHEKKCDLSLLDNDQISNIADDAKYDYVIVDETQDFSKPELYKIKSFLKENGSIYFFMDPDQSVSYDFNLAQQYVRELHHKSNGKPDLREFRLKHGYRTPSNINNLGNEILEWKRGLIGGSFYQGIQGPADNEGNDGYIKWITINDKTIENEIRELKELKEAASTSTKAILITNETVRQEAEKIFLEKAIILNPEQCEDLEPEKDQKCELKDQKYELVEQFQSKWSVINEVERLREAAKTSMKIAVLIPDESAREEAEKIFSKKAIILNPGQYRGLEFESVILFRFSELVLEKMLQKLKIRKFKELLSILSEKNATHKPKDLGRAKDMACKCVQPLTVLRNGVTRTTADLYFIETSEANEATKGFKKKVEQHFNINTEAISKEELHNYDSVLDMIIQIDKLKDKITEEKLLEFCELAYNKIIERLKREDPQECLERLVDILKDKKSKPVKSLLSSIMKEQDTYDEVNIATSSANVSSFDDKKTSALPDINMRKSESTEKRKSKKRKKSGIKEEKEESLIKDARALLNIMHGKDSRAITSKMLEQQLGNAKPEDVNILCTVIKLISLENEDQMKWLQEEIIPKISSQALNEYDAQGKSALYYIMRRDILEKIASNQTIHGGLRSFSEKITSKGLDRIGPCGWSPRHYLNKAPNLLKTVLSFNNNLKLPKQQEDCFSAPFNESTALHAAVETQHMDVMQRMNVIKFIIKNGADVNQKNCNGYTPLHLAALQDDEEIVDLLLANNANVHEKDNDGRMPLHISAVSIGMYKSVAELLLHNGADLDQQDDRGDTPLHLAVGSENELMVKFFLEKGANPNQKNGDEYTPLNIAADRGYKNITGCRGNKNITRLLLYRGADPEIRNEDNKIALDLAKESGYTEIANLIKNYLDEENTIHHIKDLQELLDIMNGTIVRKVTSKMLEQELENINVLYAIIQRLSINNSQQISWFIKSVMPKITPKALEEFDEQGNSATYYMIKEGLLLKIMHEVTEEDFQDLSIKFTEKASNRVGPCGWPARQYLKLDENLELADKLFSLNREFFAVSYIYKEISMKFMNLKPNNDFTAIQAAMVLGASEHTISFLLDNNANTNEIDRIALEFIGILEKDLSKKNTTNAKSVGVSTSLEACVSTSISDMTIHKKGKN
ncbi:hypothetical protein BIY23_03175 [Wolbachia pipientis]|uniref:Uncharacterized protein n=1 Tax=Wolbachia pipientis TaxID=955 RepID=A0A1E7QJ82_WOLPI|nr:ankyrin repeat domain-containing protein [Wolbachia pipientis]OEY86541.1 hypothetical protein BIY23_03175 [Wolbachia pipientis]